MGAIIVGYEKFPVDKIDREHQVACLNLKRRSWLDIIDRAQVDP
jgi:hypothetical protein